MDIQKLLYWHQGAFLQPQHFQLMDFAQRQRLYRLGQKEVPSQLVGEMAMDALAEIDQVAYVRFASVYKSFCDVSEFTQAIATLPKGAKKR